MLMRQLLRMGTGRDWGVPLAEEVLAVDSQEAARILQQLAEHGFIRRVGADPSGGMLWSNTVRGNALANATAAKPVRRATAERVLREFLSRVGDVNRDPYYLYAMRHAVVFGSFLSDRETVNDVDLAIDLQAKEPDAAIRERLRDERVSLAIRSGRQFSNYLQELSWPRTEVWLRLKARSRTLSLHDLADNAVIIKTGPYQVVFTVDAAGEVPPPLAD